MKEKALMIAAILIIFGLFASIIYKMEKEKCECVTFKKFDSLIIHPSGLTETSKDSICTVGGNKNGDLFLKTIN